METNQKVFLRQLHHLLPLSHVLLLLPGQHFLQVKIVILESRFIFNMPDFRPPRQKKKMKMSEMEDVKLEQLTLPKVIELFGGPEASRENEIEPRAGMFT